MAIETMRCWYAADVRTDGHPGAGHARLDHPCLLAECDACCVMLEEDGVISHTPDRAALGVALAAAGWIVTADLRALCPACKDHPLRGGRPADLASLPIPGDVPPFDLVEVAR